MIADSHCHLNILKDLPAALARSRDAGVGILQTVCTKISEFEEINQIAKENDKIFCSVGVYPHNVEIEGVPSVDQLIELTKGEKVIGIGETGLDYYHKADTKELQKESFLNHIEAAQITGLPLIIHTRLAETDMLDILKTQISKKQFKGVLHCFAGSDDFARAALKLGLSISISGIVTFQKANALQSVVKNLPLDRLLVETDAPYLAPVPFRGKTNEPAFLKYTVEALAQLLNKPFEIIAAATTQNFLDLFDKIKLSTLTKI